MVHAPRTDPDFAALGGNGIDNYQGGEVIKIIGDGGHAKVVMEILRLAPHKCSMEKCAFIAVGHNTDRANEAYTLTEEGYSFPMLVHPSAVIAAGAVINDGSVVMAGVVIQPSVRIGKHCILNTNCSVDHDCTIGDYAHIAPGAVLCGNVTVGEGALIGAGAVCVPGAVIPPWSLVKAGTVAK